MKDTIDVAQKAVTIAAIFVAGAWFLFRGEGLPRAEIDHSFYSACLSPDVRWIRAIVDVRNVGRVQLSIAANEHRLAHVFPVENAIAKALRDGESIGDEPGRIDWREISTISSDASSEFLEPGETHTQYRDFLVGSRARMVELTSFFENPARSRGVRVVGWHAKTLYDIGDESCDTRL